MLKPRLNRWIHRIQDAVYPGRCLLCGDAGCRVLELCVACRNELPGIGPACTRCGVPLPDSAVCGRCLQHPPAYDALRGPYRYAPPIDYMIKQLKFHGRLAYARLLGCLLAEALGEHKPALPTCLIPVPLHTGRLRERGFNQALELARPVALKLGLPIDYASCRRTRATTAQSLLPAAARGKNVRGAFAVEAARLPPHVVLIDDIVTTGHTVDALASALKQAGVTQVTVWTVARAG